jgi:hypothetical protein
MNQLGLERELPLITVRDGLKAFGEARHSEFTDFLRRSVPGANSAYASYEIAVLVHVMVRQDAKLGPQHIDELRNWIDREAKKFEPSTIGTIGDVDLASYRIGASIATWVNLLSLRRAAQPNMPAVSITETTDTAQAGLCRLYFGSADLGNGKEGEEANRIGVIGEAVGKLTAPEVLLSPDQADKLVSWIRCEATAPPNDPTEHQRVGSIANWLNSLR